MNVSRVTRIGSMLLDHIIMGVVLALCCSVLLYQVSVNPEMVSTMYSLSNIGVHFFLLGFSFYFCKDCIKGRSLAKRGTQLVVVRNSTGEVANPLRCLVRNLFDIFWPLEVLIVLITPDRRLGDYVAGTRVVYYNPEQHKNVPLRGGQIIISIVIGYLYFFPFLLFIRALILLNGISPN